MKQIPTLRLQHDWYLSLKPPTKFWVSCSNEGSNVFGEIKVTNQEGKVHFSETQDFRISSIDENHRWIEVECKNKSFAGKSKFYRPREAWDKVHNKKRIECIDISPGGKLAVTGSSDGQLRVWEAETGTIRRELKGHVGDILAVVFMPSGQVVMSGSSDRQIKIWRISDSLCGATLVGHQFGIVSFALIERGRNFLSSSRDGTLKLWDCASQSCISNLVSFGSYSVNDCAVEENGEICDKNQKAQSEKDYGTEGKLGLCVAENGVITAIDIRSRKPVFKDKFNEALNACVLKNGIAIAGSEYGSIIKYDLRKTTKPQSVCKRDKMPILSMVLGSKDTLWATTNDGACFHWDYKNDTMLCNLSGPNYDPLYDIAVYNRDIYTVSRDGFVRKYFV